MFLDVVPSDVEMFADRCKSMLVVDHHERDTEMKVDNIRCHTSVAKYLFELLCYPKNRTVSRLVELVDTYDTSEPSWEKAYIAASTTCIGLKQIDFFQQPFNPDKLTDELLSTARSTGARLLVQKISEPEVVLVETDCVRFWLIAEESNEISTVGRLLWIRRNCRVTKASFAFIRGQFMSVRSIGCKDARMIAQRFHGGGHDRAAAFKITKSMRKTLDAYMASRDKYPIHL